MKSFTLFAFAILSFRHADCGLASCDVIYADNKTKLVDVNEDCLHLIFNHLSLDELLYLAESSEDFIPVAADIYRQRYASKHVRIITPFSIKPIKEYRIEVSFEGISVRHFKAASMLVRHFGHLIPSLELIYNFDPAIGSEEVDKLISLHCSKTLTSFTIYSDKDGIFDDFTKPFKKVEYVTLVGHFTSLDNTNYKIGFDDLFPAMRTLYLGQIIVPDSSGINRIFPHLDDLRVYLAGPGGKSLNESDIERLIKKNPQIRKLTLMNASSKSLRIAADNLSCLERLMLLGYAEQLDEGKEIHFETLKSLTLIGGSHTMPSHISFGKLEEFETNGLPKNCTQWLDFVTNEMYLKKLRITGPLNDSEILSLALAHLKLTEMLIKCEKKVKDESIVQLIRNSEKLEKLKLLRNTYRDGTPKSTSLEATANVLRNTFCEQWTILESWYGIELERKK